MNIKVGSLSDVLGQIVAPVYVKDGEDITRIQQIRRAGSDIDKPDVSLLGARAAYEFDDQRVKLCMESWEMEAVSRRGQRLTIGFGEHSHACAAA